MTMARNSNGCGISGASVPIATKAPQAIFEGVASGVAEGNAFNWRYSMNVKANGSTWLLHFDDWMYLQDDTHLFNKTEMKKFGITVGQVTLFFTRKEQ
ncbi:Protein of uncharacterised function (DUF3833) [Serratia fonticola]|uniref:Protein of uncharacterized function (DUF3833) n=1 Tax=Serratia fonticola TaxID=47917 RepID=A0A4U9WA00_SERFO|nr:Protein of uncharacterised function (DUF3833) [Serratia fonticola]